MAIPAAWMDKIVEETTYKVLPARVEIAFAPIVVNEWHMLRRTRAVR